MTETSSGIGNGCFCKSNTGCCIGNIMALGAACSRISKTDNTRMCGGLAFEKEPRIPRAYGQTISHAICRTLHVNRVAAYCEGLFLVVMASGC